MHAVEVDQPVLVGREVGRHPVENHSEALLMQGVDEIHEVLGRAVTAGRREKAGHLVTPGWIKRMFGDGHELDMREGHLLDVPDERVGQLAIA